MTEQRSLSRAVPPPELNPFTVMPMARALLVGESSILQVQYDGSDLRWAPQDVHTDLPQAPTGLSFRTKRAGSCMILKLRPAATLHCAGATAHAHAGSRAGNQPAGAPQARALRSQ